MDPRRIRVGLREFVKGHKGLVEALCLKIGAAEQIKVSSISWAQPVDLLQFRNSPLIVFLADEGKGQQLARLHVCGLCRHGCLQWRARVEVILFFEKGDTEVEVGAEVLRIPAKRFPVIFYAFGELAFSYVECAEPVQG